MHSRCYSNSKNKMKRKFKSDRPLFLVQHVTRNTYFFMTLWNKGQVYHAYMYLKEKRVLMLIANCLFSMQNLRKLKFRLMLTFAKFGGKCEYSDDAHSIGAICRNKRCILYFYDFIERWVCFDWKNFRHYKQCLI